jgi:cell division protein FtsI/penicillin-binding protein 2
MKLVTAAASLLGQVDFTRAPSTEFVGADGQRVLNDYRLRCPGTDVQTALAHSCNSVFGWAANAVGAPALRRVADTYFGTDQNPRLQGGGATGLSTGLPEHGPIGSGALARTGIGQESARSSVLGIALATAVIANSAGAGPTWWPHLTAAICPDRSAAPVLSRHGDALGPALPSWVGQMVYDGMRKAVTEGTARTLASASASAHAELAAKTGTAQTVAGHIDSWITVIIHHRTVVTLVIHDAPDEAAAGQAADRVLAALPPTAAVPSCAPPTRPRALDVHDTAVRWQPEG